MFRLSQSFSSEFLLLANYAWILHRKLEAIGSLLRLLGLLFRCQSSGCRRRWIERYFDLRSNVSQSAVGCAGHHPIVDAATVRWFIVDQDFDLSLFIEQGFTSISITTHRIVRPEEVAELRSVVIVLLAIFIGRFPQIDGFKNKRIWVFHHRPKSWNGTCRPLHHFGCDFCMTSGSRCLPSWSHRVQVWLHSRLRRTCALYGTLLLPEAHHPPVSSSSRNRR